ncbi:MAG: low molecular weight protein tyrosine phosphatase family protein [Cyanophyceae cyanobacterium]
MSQRQQRESKNINVLFVCSMNKWRSPTAEKIYSNQPFVNVHSAGTSAKAKRHVSAKDLKWADLVIAMEPKHVQRLKADFPEFMRHTEVHSLGVEDRYGYMHPELVEELKAAIAPILESYV